MSKTIITKSGSNFLTNISTERLLGELLRECGAKHEVEDLFNAADMPTDMTEDEAKEASEKLLNLLKREDESWINDYIIPFLGSKGTKDDLEKFIIEMANLLIISKGYYLVF